MAPSFSRVSSGALLLALAYNTRPVNADFSEDVDNCKLVLEDLPADLTTEFCQDWTSGYQPDYDYATVTGIPVTITEYPEAKTCESEGYSTTTGYPEYTPGPSNGYQPWKPTNVSESIEVPYETAKVPYETTEASYWTSGAPYSTTKAPDQPPATYVPGAYDATVTSTTWTTYWTTSTVYEGYPTATPAPYRRHARDLKDRAAAATAAAWCDDRPCRLVPYDDNTIGEACKQYLNWEPLTSTVSIPGYTVIVTSYPTDCVNKDDGYPSDSAPAYPTETNEGYQPEPYPTETPEVYPTQNDYPEETPGYEPQPYPTTEGYPTETPNYPQYPEETPEYEPQPYSTTENYPTETPNYPQYPEETPEYPQYPEETPEYEPQPYSTTENYPTETLGYPQYPEETPEYEPQPYPTNEGYPTVTPDYPEYTDYPEYPSQAAQYEPEPAPTSYPEDEPDYDNDPAYTDDYADYQDSDSEDAQPSQNAFDNNYSGPDGPYPWDDADQTSELADAIEAGGYDSAVQNLGLDDAPSNALPADYRQKRSE